MADKGSPLEHVDSRPAMLLKPLRNPHLWAVTALVVLLGLIYYADQLTGVDWRFFTADYLHDVHRALFLVPMLYAAAVFRMRGALVLSAVALAIMLPRAIYVSPHQDPLLRAMVFAAVATLATILLALVQERTQRERRALHQVDRANRDLESSAEQLRASEGRYRELFSSASDAIYVRSLEGVITEANWSTSNLTGYPPEQLIGMSIKAFLAPDSLEKAMEGQQALLSGASAAQRYELEVLREDGTTATIEAVTRLVHRDGQAVGVEAIARDVTEAKRWRENVLYYMSEVARAQEEERKRIARELHDETAQDLATLLLDIESVSRVSEGLSDKTIERLQNLRERATSIMEGIRRLSHELRPDVLDHLGLVAALEWLGDEVMASHQIEAAVKVSGTARRLPSEVEVLLFRIAQEALSNVRKHSKAAQAKVTVEFGAEYVELTVSDNGSGFEVPQVLGDLATAGKLGLLGMQERTRLLGGELSVRSVPQQGTTVSVKAPW